MADPTATDGILKAFELAALRGAWHPTLRQALDGVDAAQARWRPAEGRNSIWDLVRHLIVWRRATLESWERPWTREEVRRYETGDWPPLPERAGAIADEEAWRRDVAELLALTEALLERVRGLEPAELGAVREGASTARGWNLLNIATHDAYHAGQIVLLRRLQEG